VDTNEVSVFGSIYRRYPAGWLSILGIPTILVGIIMMLYISNIAKLFYLVSLKSSSKKVICYIEFRVIFYIEFRVIQYRVKVIEYSIYVNSS